MIRPGIDAIPITLAADLSSGDLLDRLAELDAGLGEQAKLAVTSPACEVLPGHSSSAGPALLPRFLALARRYGFLPVPNTTEVSTPLALQRRQRPRWLPRRIVPADGAAVRHLFSTVFDKPMSDALWIWKYQTGGGAAIGVWEGGTLIAHYGGVPRLVRFNGETVRAAQSGDVMVAPSGRGTLSRQGPLAIACATYLETQLGFNNPQLLGFGFPNRRAFAAPARLGFYGGPVGRMVELAWPAAPGMPSAAVRIRPSRLDTAADCAAVDTCWAEMAAALTKAIVGVRDAAYLRYRYLDHPEHHYRLFIARRRLGGRPLGAFVLRAIAGGGCELLDLVAPPATAPALLAHARRAAATEGCDRLWCWASENMLPYLRSGATVRDLDVAIPANIWTPAPDVATLSGRWWLTGGDTDFH